MENKEKKYMFRDLKANEIDVRVATVKENGISLLLYKDARVDQDILDETVGAMDWQRKHLRDNANCIVEIWDKEKKQWIGKEDTGTESFSQAEKGLASDSFKRACFNWGIGRELYTSPFIWISSDNCNISDTKRKDKNGKNILTCKDTFRVKEIEIQDKVITKLVICNEKKKLIAFSYPDTTKQLRPNTITEANMSDKIGKKEIGILERTVTKYNKTETDVLSILMKYGYKDFSEIKMKDYAKIGNELSK